MKQLEIGKDQRRQMVRTLATAKVSNSRVASSANASQISDLVASLSSEALHLVSKREGSGGRPEQITQALNDFMMSATLESTEAAKPAGKRQVVKRKVDWNPSARVGELREGLSAMGSLRVTDEISEEESPEGQSGAQTSLGISFQGSGSGGRLQISLKHRAPSKKAGSQGPRIEGGEALHNLMKNGMVADGLSSLIHGGFQGASGSQSRELTVRTNGTGLQRVLSVKSAGSLDKNTTALGSFQMMENKPIVKKATDSQGLKNSQAKPPARIFRQFFGR